MTDLAPRVVTPRLGRLGTPYLWVQECASTQDVLRAGTHLREGAVAVAEQQTAGRGRRGRRWESRAGEALLCSVLLEPPPGESARYPLLSLVAALAVAEAVEEATGLAAGVKWPNDVLLEGKKAAGILLEAIGSRVIVGIGVNVNQPDGGLPTGTRVPAGSLASIAGGRYDRGLLLAAILERLAHSYDRWLMRDPTLTADLEARNVLRGREVTADGASGVAGAITESGMLEVATDQGVTLVGSGEVTLPATAR